MTEQTLADKWGLVCDSLIKVFTKLEEGPQTLTGVRAALFVSLTNPVFTGVSVVIGKLEVGLQKLTVFLTVYLKTGKLK